MRIEDILREQGKKIEERHRAGNITFPACITIEPEDIIGISKYRIGETIIPNGTNCEFIYGGLIKGEYIFDVVELRKENEAV